MKSTEKIAALIEAFTELVNNDPEEAEAVLKAAGKDPSLIVKNGINKLDNIKHTLAERRKKNCEVTSSECNVYPYPVVWYNKKNNSVSISNRIKKEEVLTSKEAFPLFVKKQSLRSIDFKSLNLSESTQHLKFQRFLKSIIFLVELNSNKAKIYPRIDGLLENSIGIEDVKLIIETGYYITNNTCYPIDSDSIKSASDLLFKSNGTDFIPLNIALTLYSKRNEFSFIRFNNEEFNLKDIIESKLYTSRTKLFIKDLYPYQEDGLQWLMYCCINRIGGILADDMGLGKTAQIIALVANLIETDILKPILIVVPSTLLENWKREFQFFAPSIIPYIHHGNFRTGSPIFLTQYKVIITSYSLIINDLYLFNKIDWGITILDEASLIKNPSSERRIALKDLSSEVKIAMTGTPVENSLLDLWSLADYVYPDYLGTKDDFASLYVNKDLGVNLENSSLSQLKSVISYIMLRRKKEDVLDNLPERIDIHQALTMNEDEALIYDKKRNDILEDMHNNPGAQILKLIMELRMFTTHPYLRNPDLQTHLSLNDLKSSSHKFKRTLELLHEVSLRDEKVLIFTEYLTMIDLFRSTLSSYYEMEVLTIDGRIPIEERQQNIDTFSKKDGFNIMILNPKTAGMGLNITAANHIIHYTRQWNPALEEQASARAYRNGQNKGVNVYYLYYTDTIEEIIDNRLRSKMALSDEVISITESNDNMEEYLITLNKSPLK
jgi:SNF2 family DNA or RNA helicase